MNVQCLGKTFLAVILAAALTLTVQAEPTWFITFDDDDFDSADVYDTDYAPQDEFITGYLVHGGEGYKVVRMPVGGSNYEIATTRFTGNTLSLFVGDVVIPVGTLHDDAKQFAGIYVDPEHSFYEGTARRTLSFGNLTVNWDKENGELYGFYAAGDFGGTLRAGNMIVENTNGDALGYLFGDAGESKSILSTGQINVGTLSVTAGGTGIATGFKANITSGASINLNGSITAAAKGNGEAVGLDITGTGTPTGNITIGQNISATSVGGDATAVSAKDINITLNTANNPGLNIYGSNGSGTGKSIGFLGNDETLTIQGSNTFTNAGRDFIVEFAKNGTINFNTNVSLTAGSLKADEKLDVTVGANRSVQLGNTAITADTLTLEVKGGALFHTSGTVTLEGNDNEIKGGGTVYFSGTIKVENEANLTVTSATFGLDVSKMVLEDTFTIALESGSTLELYGTGLPDGWDSDNLVITGELSQITSKSIFGAWVPVNVTPGSGFTLDNTSFQPYDSACMSDGFLAAAMIHNRYTGYGIVSKHFLSASAPSAPRQHLYRGQSTHGMFCACEDCLERATPPAVRRAWLNYVGRGDIYQGWNEGNGWKIGAHGAQLGFDLWRTNARQFGFIFGYERGKATNAGDQIDADDFYMGFYTARVFQNGLDARFLFNLGLQQFWMERNGWRSDFNGSTQEFNLELGRRFHHGGLSVRPLIGADFYLAHLGGATEGGSGNIGEHVSYDKTSLTQMFLRSGFDWQARYRSVAFNGSLFYSHDVRGQELRTHVWEQRDGGADAPLIGTAMGGSLLSFDIGCEYYLAKNVSFFGGYEGRAVLDRSGGYQSVGYVGGLWRY